jgi:RNA polymerase sigma factor (TIGR02999 family)
VTEVLEPIRPRSDPLTEVDTTEVLNAAGRGDARAAEQLLPLVYEELRRLAARKMAREASDHTLQPTALVHEAYARLIGAGVERKWNGRSHFYAAAASAMRRILLDQARRKHSAKCGGNWIRKDLDVDLLVTEPAGEVKLLGLDIALTRLSEIQPQVAKLVELRFFIGVSIEEAAQLLDISRRTANRHWTYARAYIRRELERMNGL